MDHQGTKILETGRLVLRRFRAEDAEAMYRNWASDPEVTKFLTWPVHSGPETSRRIIGDWLQCYADEKYYHWAITLKENGDEPIGSIAVVALSERISAAQIGYCIGKNWWHRGIMPEALQAVMDYLFDVVEVNRIEARHDPRNDNSGKVMQKCGMKYEGMLRSADWNNQGVCDMCVWALLREDRMGAPA